MSKDDFIVEIALAGEKVGPCTWQVPVDGVRVANVSCPEGTNNALVECAVADLSQVEVDESLFAELAEMNFFWRGTRGWTVGFRDGIVFLSGRIGYGRLDGAFDLSARLSGLAQAVETVYGTVVAALRPAADDTAPKEVFRV